jgi:hypothetical protein
MEGNASDPESLRAWMRRLQVWLIEVELELREAIEARHRDNFDAPAQVGGCRVGRERRTLRRGQ